MDIKDVENLAELAKIEMSSEEKTQTLKDMEGILNYVKVIETVKVKDAKTEPEVFNVWREDNTTPRDFSVEIIKNQFPESQDGFLKVKKILP